MRKLGILLVGSILASSLPALASADEGKPCSTVAKACLEAGYTHVESADSDKAIWKNCMLPTLKGKKISGVHVSPATAEACKANKLLELKKDLDDLES